MAKTPGYIVTGGDLGEYAMHFYTDDYLEHPNAEAVEVEAPDAASLEAPYLLYSTWPFAVAEELASGRPLAYLYAGERLVHNPETGAWLKISDKLWDGSANWSGVGKAIDVAKTALAAGKLDRGAVLAAFLGRDFDRALWDVFGGTGASVQVSPPDIRPESAREFFNGGPDPRRGPDGAPPVRMNAAQFPLEALAQSLSQPFLERATEVGAADRTYVMYVHGPTTSGGMWSGPAFLYYSPPVVARPGLLWEGTPSGPPVVWESTPEFDRLFAEALTHAFPPPQAPQGLATSPSPSAVAEADSRSLVEKAPSLLLVPLVAVVALGALAGLVLNLWRGLRGRRRAYGRSALRPYGRGGYRPWTACRAAPTLSSWTAFWTSSVIRR